MTLIINAALAVLCGVYAIRATWFLFSGYFSPLTPVAAAVLVFCIVLFHKPPTVTGAWFYSVIGICVVALVANAILLFVAHEAYSNKTNQMFSAVSVIAWAVLIAGYVYSVYFQQRSSIPIGE
jgi:hypothetical protein